jgi:hypothetical protein
LQLAQEFPTCIYYPVFLYIFRISNKSALN